MIGVASSNSVVKAFAEAEGKTQFVALLEKDFHGGIPQKTINQGVGLIALGLGAVLPKVSRDMTPAELADFWS